MRSCVVLSLLFTCAVLPSCKDDGPSEGGGGDGGATPAEVTSFIADLCALYEPCCGDGASTKEACVQATTERAQKEEFDAQAAQACLDAARVEAKASTFCARPPTDVACSAVFKRKAPKDPGAACMSSSECASGGDGLGICVDKKCRHVTRGKEGDACIGTRAPDTIDALVAPPDGATALCDAGEGLYCSEGSRTCQRRGEPGADCSGSDLSCVDAAWCPTTTSECVTRTAAGEPCTDAFECAPGHQCANDGEGGGACTAFVGEGGACERGDECDPAGLVCDSATATCIKDTSTYSSACTGALALGDPY